MSNERPPCPLCNGDHGDHDENCPMGILEQIAAVLDPVMGKFELRMPEKFAPPAIICPECKAPQPRTIQVSDKDWENNTWTCVKCGHSWKPDPFQNMDLDAERRGLHIGMDHYDKNGVPISMGEWARRFEDPKYKQVAYTNFGDIEVSTVWLGTDHNHFARFAPEDADVDRRPIIFETMLFKNFKERLEARQRGDPEWYKIGINEDNEDDEPEDGMQWRYATLDEAIEGHHRVVEWVKEKLLPPEAEEWVKKVLTEVNRD